MVQQLEIILATRATLETAIAALDAGVETPTITEMAGDPSLLFHLQHMLETYGRGALLLTDAEAYSDLRARCQRDDTRLLLCAAERWEMFGSMLSAGMPFEVIQKSDAFMFLARTPHAEVTVDAEPA